MAQRRRRAEEPRPLWPPLAGLAAGVLLGIFLWGFAPSLPPELLIERYGGPASRFVDVGGARAHIRDEGLRDDQPRDASEGAPLPIVLIHGSMGSLHMWEGWVAALGHRARLISVDLPGHGLTGAWPRDEYTIEAYGDFIEVLVDTLGLDRFVLVGHSMGGAVAWSFAATRPDRVSHLVLVDAAGYPRDGPAPLPTRLARLPVVGDLGIWFKPEIVVRRSLTEVYADPKMVTPERVRRYAELQRFPGNRQATLQRARTQEPLDPTTLKRLRVPTLVLWGARDRWVPPADGQRFLNDIRGAKLEVFGALGHNPMEEDPAATAQAVDAFLPARLAPRPPLPQPATSAGPGSDDVVAPSVVPERWDPLESTCRHASLSIL